MTNEIFSIIRNGLTEHYHLSISSTPINCDNELGQNLLQEAIAYYRNSIAVDLVNRGININHQDNRGLTPLHYCVQHNNLTIAELLLAKGGKYSGLLRQQPVMVCCFLCGWRLPICQVAH